MVDAPNPQTYNARPILGPIAGLKGAGWSSLVARRAHNPKIRWFESSSRYQTLEKSHILQFCDFVGLYEPLMSEEVFLKVNF